MDTEGTQAQLKRNPLGTRSGIEVTDVGLGLWAVSGSEWGPVEDEANLEAIEVALQSGVEFFDTADVYGEGHSEELLGRAMAGRREKFVAATKIGWIGFDRETGRSRYDTIDKVEADVDKSLHRLGTGYVDVIQCHIDFREPNTPVIIEAFRKLKNDGKVKAWGVSTSDLELLQFFNSGKDCDVLQTDYSILNRTAEKEIFPYCLDNGIGVIVRGPLAMGLLTGKYSADDTFPEGDFRRGWIEDSQQNEQFLADLSVVEDLRPLVPEGQSMAQFALRFVRSQPAVSVVIPGAKNRRQAASNAAAARMPLLSDEEQVAVDAVVPPGGGRKIWPA